MPRNTKADRILLDAEMRLEAARIRQRTAQSELNTATATLDALQEAYDALKKELTPTPRKKSTPRAQSISAAIAKTPKVDAGSTTLDADTPKCGICGNVPDHPDHDPTYLSSHVFEAPKSVASATRRSSRKGAVTNSTVSSETSSEGALAVGAGGD